jgi:competence protein ComEA
MSDDSNDLPPLPRPGLGPGLGGWRDQLNAYAENLDLTPTRLLLGVVAAAVVVVVGWRLFIAAPASPPEAHLPMVTTVPGTPGHDAGTSSDGSLPPTTMATEVVVHVAGAVAKPGVQRLKPGSRVVDAVDAAGGSAPDADLGRINLAAVLEDGQQVYVPKVGEAGGGAAAPGPARAGDTATGSTPSGQPIHLNTATAAELEALSGIGPALAEAIVSYRNEHGPFSSVDELLDVRGIGQAKLEALREQVVL